jgi:hypothetical protein
LAALAVALGVGQAHAGITCNLNDQHGNALQYSFTRGETVTSTRSSSCAMA